MGRAILVTGGARSGKSKFAEQLIGEIGQKVLYIATSIVMDEEMQKRVEVHQQSRPKHWDIFEGYQDLHKVIQDRGEEYLGILIDCVTILITNLMFAVPHVDFSDLNEHNIELIQKTIDQQIESLLEAIGECEATVVLVTNELGCGIVPESKLGRIFRDIAGRVNQRLGVYANEVYLVVCGIPLQIK